MMNPKNKQPTNATERISKKIDVLFYRLIRQVSGLSVGVKLSSKKEIFSFENNPKIQKIIAEILQNHAKKIIETINQETENQWLLSAQNNDLWVSSYLAKNGISAEKISHYTSRNWEALRAFQKRKTDGLGLSDRIWKYTDQLKTELEMGLDLGLREGKSAQQISRDIRQYLHEPNVLFRRVRDTHGSLHLSKQAQKMGVGRGVYRSSYKNAMRVARTEVNMAYRASDMERYRGLDFVVGYEVRRSNHIFSCPVCEALKGKYPKEFTFLGWHPQCRCHTIPILEGKKIVDVPGNFKEWVSGNQQRFENKKPLFLQQNQGYWERVKSIEYKKISSQEFEKMYQKQIISAKNENIIMGRETEGYVATANSFHINEKLRKNIPISEENQKIVNALDSLIAQNKLKDNYTLYRYDGFGFIEAHFGVDISDMTTKNAIEVMKSIGKKEFSDAGFYSVSAIKEKNYFKGRKIQSEIRVKKGINAFITNNYEESEIILGRNQRFHILSISEENNKIKLILENIN